MAAPRRDRRGGLGEGRRPRRPTAERPTSRLAGPGELKFLLLSTRTPAVAEFTGPDGGKITHYMLRWLSSRGETGPWSETASATIGA